MLANGEDDDLKLILHAFLSLVLEIEEYADIALKKEYNLYPDLFLDDDE